MEGVFPRCASDCSVGLTFGCVFQRIFAFSIPKFSPMPQWAPPPDITASQPTPFHQRRISRTMCRMMCIPPHNRGVCRATCGEPVQRGACRPGVDRTLLAVVFDEHGGCYDHAVPPAAAPAGRPARNGFTFDRFGPRVPASIISPYVQAGSIVRPPEGAPPFDHTSLIATLNAVFDLGSPLSPRAAAAPNLISALQLEQPENMGPPCIDVAVSRPTREEMLAMHRRPRNSYQRRLRWPGSLPRRARGQGCSRPIRTTPGAACAETISARARNRLPHVRGSFAVTASALSGSAIASTQERGKAAIPAEERKAGE